MEEKTRSSTSEITWNIYFPKLRYWTIGSMVVILISLVILNLVCPLYTEWFFDKYEGYLGVSHTIIAGWSVIGVAAFLKLKSENRVKVAAYVVIIDSIAAVWQTWNFWDKAGHFSYIEQRAFNVLIVETVILVICCIMAVHSFRVIMEVDEESNNEEA